MSVQARCDPDRTKELFRRFMGECDGETAIDTAVAAQTILCEAIYTMSEDLQFALDNLDRMTEALKIRLRERMSH